MTPLVVNIGIYILYSNFKYKQICTRSFNHFNYKYTIEDHLTSCANKVPIGNLIDQVKITDGFKKVHRHRRLDSLISHSVKMTKELEQMEA